MAEVGDAQGGQVGAVREDEAAAGDAVGPEAFLGREAEGKAARTLPLPPPLRSHAHTLTHTLSSGPPVQAPPRAGVSRPGRQPRTSYWGKPSCTTHSATSSALQDRKGQTGPPAPSGSGCGPSATPGPAGPGRGSIGSIPRPPGQRVLPGPRYPGNHHFLEVRPVLPSATPSLLSACNAARAPRLCRTKC